MSTLLQLPPHLKLERAKILLLKITVPADLYTSGILIEVEGVEFRLHVDSAKKERKEKVASKTKYTGPSKGVGADRPRSTQSLVHDPGGLQPHTPSDTDEEDDEAQSDQIPTTTDLAQSFLQTEASEEKAELQATIARSHYLEQSQASSDSGDEPSGMGVAEGLSLPGFLADFLKGVCERVQVRIKNVEVDTVLHLNALPESSNRSENPDRSEAVTVRVLVEGLHLDSVINEPPTSGDAEFQGKTKAPANSASPSSKDEGSRRISLQKIHGLLLSDASVFANASRFYPPSSPEATQISAFGHSNRESPRPMSNSTHSSSSSNIQYERHPDKTNGRSVESSSMLEASVATSDGGRLPEALFEHGREGVVASNDPPYYENVHDQDSVLADSFYSERHDSYLGNEKLVDPEIFLRGSSNAEKLTLSACEQESVPLSEEAEGTPGDDLTQSKIFSHEEAESMYMSAISHASSRNSGRSRVFPGQWDDLSSGEEENDANLSISPTGQAQNRAARGGSGFLAGQHGAPNDPRTPIKEPYVTPKQSPTAIASLSSLDTFSAAKPPAVSNVTLPFYASSQKSELSSTKSEKPLIILKRFMTVDSIVLNVGHQLSNVVTEPANIAASTTRLDNRRANIGTSSSAVHPFGSEEVEKLFGREISLELGSIDLVGDVGLTKLTILILQQITDVLNNKSPKKTDATIPEPISRIMKLRVQSTCWKFVDSVKGFAVPDSRISRAEAGTIPLSCGAEVLLKADVKDLSAIYRTSGSLMSSRVTARKLSFGYESSNILSFDSSLKLRESTRDILAPIDHDVVLICTNMHGALKVECTTLPLHISLDLRRLDETFGWFGGFSSMLGLGSSMMSTVTVVDKSRTSQLPKPRRGVHFETAEQSNPQDHDSHSERKITARIGGIVLDLHGTGSSMRLESSALKLVSRLEGLGVQLDKLNFSGPDMRIEGEVPSITIKLANIRLEYLSTPKEVDLVRLLSLLSPSKDKYEHDDDILLDTLLRQRRQGGVIRVTIDNLDCRVSELRDLESFPILVEELKKLSTVTKYLPEDDRPGILTLGLVRKCQVEVFVNSSFGTAICNTKNVEVAHVTLPSLTALGITSVQLHRNQSEELLGKVLAMDTGHAAPVPMVMGRFVGNEMDPTVKIKLHNLRAEYHVPTIMAIMGLSDLVTAEAIIADIANSVATVKNRGDLGGSPAKPSSQTSSSNDKSATSSKTLRFDIAVRDSIIGLNPRNSQGRGLIVLTDTQFIGILPKEDEASATLDISKASLMIIDDVLNAVLLDNPERHSSSGVQHSQIQGLSDMGYVSVGSISAAKATIKVTETDGSQSIDVDIRDDLLVLESCADSTQTLLSIMNGLSPPMPPSTELKYRTEVVPVQDMLASLSGNAFVTGDSGDGNDDDYPLGFDEGDMVDDEVPENLEFVSSFYNPDPHGLYDGIAESMLEEDLESIASPPRIQEIGDKRLLASFQEKLQIAPGGAPLDFREDHFGVSPTVGGTAHRWDTKQNTYGLTDDFKIGGIPMRVRVRDVHFIWNLFDGYDWQHTRDIISEAVAGVQSKAMERRSKADRRKSFDAEEEEDSVIGDFLFNSIYIGIPANRDPKELSRQVNRNLDDLVSETESYATSSASGSPSRQGQKPRLKGKRLRLSRSKYHKMTFELKGISADFLVFSPSADEIQSSLDIRVHDLEIFDHVPTSTWKKFATYMHDAGERESGTSMIHLEISNVKPVPTLAASEIILKVCSLSS